MGYVTTKKEEFKKWLDFLGLSESDVIRESRFLANIYLRYKDTLEQPDQKTDPAIEYSQILLNMRRIITTLEKEVADLKQKIAEINQVNETQTDRIDKSWDVLSDRIADLEKHFQQKIEPNTPVPPKIKFIRKNA